MARRPSRAPKQAVTRTLDAAAVLKRRDYFTSNWQDDSQVKWVEDTGIELIRGHGWITAPRKVEVAGLDGNSYLLSARHAVVVATGSAPNLPPVDGLDDVEYWTTREATSAREVPARLAVLGGGVAGVELAQAYARLGAAVTLVAADGLLAFSRSRPRTWSRPACAPTASISTCTPERGASSEDDGRHPHRSTRLDGGTTITADKLLVSTGRHPALEGSAWTAWGSPAPRAGPCGSDRFHRTSAHRRPPRTMRPATRWLYAAGDAAGRAMLTHQGKYEARATGDAIAARAKGELDGEPAPWSRYAQTADEHAMPNVVFTDPELANVGRTVEQAEKDGFRVSSVELPIQVAGSSLHAEHYEGWAQLVVDEDRKVLLGATFAGPDVAELLHAATIAVVGEVPLDRLWHAVPSYPTVSEVWLRLLEDYGL